ncbi:MAG: hypothetical protein P8078_12375, partial [bacterium]
DPTANVREMDRITRRKKPAKGQSAKAFNPLSRDELQLFKTLMDGEHDVRGFVNRDIREKPATAPHFTGIRKDPKRQSAKVSRILRRFHLHGLIAKKCG